MKKLFLIFALMCMLSVNAFAGGPRHHGGRGRHHDEVGITVGVVVLVVTFIAVTFTSVIDCVKR